MGLEDKVAIVTGASSGIGQAVAERLVADGARVVMAARRIDRLQEIEGRLVEGGGQVLAVETDVTDRSAVEALAAATLERFGALDILVNNAGVMPLSLMKNLHVEEWDRMIDVNIRGVLYGIAAVLPHMLARGAGHIVNISSTAGRRLFPAGAVYCGTKFAVHAISEGLRQELSASEGIRVTVIGPGATFSELTHTITDEDVLAQSGPFDDMRMLDPEDVASSVAHALSQPEHVNVAEVMVLPRAQVS